MGFESARAGAKTVKAILDFWRGLRTLAEIFAEADNDGILLAESCIFKPKQSKQCIGGAA